MMSNARGSSRRAGVRRAGILEVLVPARILLPGCTSPIEVSPPPAANQVAAATAVPQHHNVAIVGVDFDPPLDYAKLLANGSVTLMVAIENRGEETEPLVSVNARLLDPRDRQHDLVNEVVDVRVLKPREVRVVRFAPVSDLVSLDQYLLEVEIPPVGGETVTADNQRTYDIVLRQGN